MRLGPLLLGAIGIGAGAVLLVVIALRLVGSSPTPAAPPSVVKQAATPAPATVPAAATSPPTQPATTTPLPASPTMTPTPTMTLTPTTPPTQTPLPTRTATPTPSPTPRLPDTPRDVAIASCGADVALSEKEKAERCKPDRFVEEIEDGRIIIHMQYGPSVFLQPPDGYRMELRRCPREGRTSNPLETKDTQGRGFFPDICEAKFKRLF